MADGHKNFSVSTVATAPSPATSGTSLVVAAADGAKFPTVPFNATVWPIGTQPSTTNAEIVRVTAISTDTLTITRAQESSSARTVIVGDQIAATITAKTITDVESGTSLTVIDAKGDLIVGTANDTASRLAVGADDTILMADAAQATGLKYVAPATPGNSVPGDAAAAGTSDDFARGTHVHGRVAEGASWTSYSPALTNFTLGNGTRTAAYMAIGKTIHLRVRVTFGSTTSTSNYPDIDLPATAVMPVQYYPIGSGMAWDVSAGLICQITPVLTSTTLLHMFAWRTDGLYANHGEITSITPFTWATGDHFLLSCTYEAA